MALVSRKLDQQRGRAIQLDKSVSDAKHRHSPRLPAHPRLPDFSDGHGGRLLSRLKDQPQKLGLAASNRHTTIISLDVVASMVAAAVFILASSISAAGLGLNPS